jgi:hypothetical protein
MLLGLTGGVIVACGVLVLVLRGVGEDVLRPVDVLESQAVTMRSSAPMTIR